MSPSRLPRDSGAPPAANLPPRNPEEAELVGELMEGNEEAFATFYDRFAPGLFSMIFAILHDQKESEDVLQESFVQMWKRSRTYDPGRSSLFTWAVMISRHKAIDRLRARQRQNRLIETASAEGEHQPIAMAQERDENAFTFRDERERVRAALAQLGDGQREAIDLAFFAGLTQSEIATRLGTPLGTIKARIRRGLLALREVLGRNRS